MKQARANNNLPGQLEPGEKLLYTIRASRRPGSVIHTLLINAFLLLTVTLLTRLCSRILVESYIHPSGLLTPANLITLNLFLGITPFFAFFVLLYQFFTGFTLVLTLTDRRITGRVLGVWGPRLIQFRLHEVESLYAWLGYLHLQSGRRRLVVGGFDDVDGFIAMFRSAAPTVRAHRPIPARSTSL